MEQPREPVGELVRTPTPTHSRRGLAAAIAIFALTVGQLAIATFNNPAGLVKAGQSHLRASNSSGQPMIGIPGDAGKGSLLSGALEMSNVELAQEFTNLIIAQRGFQANSRVITTSDQMLQDLVDIKR